METGQTHQLFDNLTETLSRNATVRKVFGDPVETQGKTIIPVAKISLGFGGGFGKNTEANASEVNKTKPKGEGGGLGGGLMAHPIGFIELTPQKTRFVRFDVYKYVALGVVIGLAIGRFGLRRRHKLQNPPI